MHTFHQATRAGSERTLTVLLDDGLLVVDSDNPNYEKILLGASGDATSEELKDLADLSQTVAKKFDAIGRRVSVSNGVVYFDGDPVHNALTNHIVRALDQGADFQPLVKFYEKLAANPNSHSREQLYEWLDRRDFAILPDGNFVAYKGCARGSDGVAVSVHRGKAVVNGEAVNGAVPNPIGAVVEFPRTEVEWDPSAGCARGLHVGDYEYASSWARGVLLVVSVDPGDVVSVPTDSNWAKVRVCRYTVTDVYDKPAPISSAVYAEDPDDYEEFEEEEDVEIVGTKCGDPTCYCSDDPAYEG
jgi:hypothetical protein